MTQPIQITLPWPAPVLRSNASHGKHWGPKHSATSAARTSAFSVAQSKGVGCWPSASIMIEYYPPTLRGDPQNVPSSLKAYIDGIADAMGCDDKHFRVDYPRVFAGTRKGGEVVFRVYET